MDSWFLFIALILSIASNVALNLFLSNLHQKEKKELHDRLMSRDYPEYKQGQAVDHEIKLAEDKQKEKMSKKFSKEELESQRAADRM